MSFTNPFSGTFAYQGLLPSAAMNYINVNFPNCLDKANGDTITGDINFDGTFLLFGSATQVNWSGTSQLNLSGTSAFAIYSPATMNLSTNVTVGDGGSFPGSLQVMNNGTLNFQTGSVLSGVINLAASSIINIKSGAILELKSGSGQIVDSGAQIEFKGGSTALFDSSSSLVLSTGSGFRRGSASIKSMVDFQYSRLSADVSFAGSSFTATPLYTQHINCLPGDIVMVDCNYIMLSSGSSAGDYGIAQVQISDGGLGVDPNQYASTKVTAGSGTGGPAQVSSSFIYTVSVGGVVQFTTFMRPTNGSVIMYGNNVYGTSSMRTVVYRP